MDLNLDFEELRDVQYLTNGGMCSIYTAEWRGRRVVVKVSNLALVGCWLLVDAFADASNRRATCRSGNQGSTWAQPDRQAKATVAFQ